MMNTYIIPKQDHQRLYIFEGSLLNYTIKNNELSIVVRCIDYPNLPKETPTPDYLDWARIKFKKFSYLKLEYSYRRREQKQSVCSSIELGELKDHDELLDYGGGLTVLGRRHDIPTYWSIEIVCQEIELEFLGRDFGDFVLELSN